MVEIPSVEPFDIPGYRIVRRLGQGGMADVYLAIQLSLGRPVAIKVLAAERTPSDELVTRFEHEARTIARLDHPHIVSIFDVGRTSTGQLYYTMPHLPNGDLAARDVQQDQAAIIAIVRALCQALAYAHEQSIVHRDVKPENVLFDKLDRPLLADFGIALTTIGQTRVTREGDTLGSIAYMSPEQARGQALDGRSDLYSLGVVCYERLTGTLPFTGLDSLAVALAHVEQPVPRLPPARRHWQGFIDKAMAKSPDERFQTASEMLDALNAVEKRLALVAPIAAVATSLAAMPERLDRSLHEPVSSRPKAAVAVVALGVALLAVWLLHRFNAATQAVVENGDKSISASGIQGAMDRAIPVAASGAPIAAAPAGAAPAPEPANDSIMAADQEATSSSASAHGPEVAPTGARTKSSPAAIAAPRTLKHDAGAPEIVFVPAQGQHGDRTYSIDHTFALGRYEVTRGEYAEFARATGRPAAKCREPMQPLSWLQKLDWRDPGFEQDDRHPVVCVSWDDANAYVHWLSERTHQHYRLPGQGEWVYAARLQPTGDNACARGNVADVSNSSFLHLSSRFSCNDEFAHTAPVGHYAPSMLGIYDLQGNVSEWTRDCAPGNAWAKFTEDSRCSERVFRGTSWRDGPTRHNLEFSGNASPDVGYTTVGIRVLRELPQADAADGSAHESR